MHEQDPLRGDRSVKSAAKDVRRGFIRKVYGILSAQLLLTVAIATPIWKLGPEWARANQWLLYLSLFGLIAAMCVMMCCQEYLRRFPTNYIILLVITCAMSVMVGFASAMYTWQSVLLAAGITVAIFLGMTAYAWCTDTDFTGFGPYLFAGLLCLMVFGLALTVMSWFGVNIKWLMMFYDICGVLLFTFYIVFDTQLIMGEYGGHKNSFGIDDYAFAALNLYLDIINLFLHLLSLLGDRR